ncbi:MAG: B12-binding domain-containing radical SAM protein [Faecalimonas sp.]|nr:B12-binding domain-containing radical SAM protein [Faecalimonas sp.]
MRVVLVAINAKYIHSNLAVHSLRAYAQPYQSEIEIAEYTINQQVDEILQDIYKRQPELLCFSCYIWNLRYVETLVRELKKVLPRTQIWVGGPEVSYDAAEVLERLPELSGVMKGEGEATFLELLQYYHAESEHTLAAIAGISYRDCEENICENTWREILDLSRLPFVYQNLAEFENKILYYESSRGCPFSCSYCLSSVDKCLRFRDLELVKKELQVFIDYRVPQVKFVDRTFNCHHKHAMEIWKYLLAHDEGVTNFHFEVAVDLLNEEELQLIAQMRPGLIQLEIGVQSTNVDTIREIRRTMEFSKVAEVVKRIQSAGNVHQHLDLIAGLPYEDLQSFQGSFDAVYELKPEQLQLGFLKVLKGSYMEEQKEAYALCYKSEAPYEVLSTKWLSYADILVLKQVEEMVEVYYNSGQFHHTMRQLEQEFDSAFEMYQRLGAFYEANKLSMKSHTRVARYEILLAFIRSLPVKEEGLYAQLLTLDLYLRENVKTRPAFAGEYTVSKEEANVFRRLQKRTHLERFTYDVLGDGSKKELLLLFDYENRNVLTQEAKLFPITTLQK